MLFQNSGLNHETSDSDHCHCLYFRRVGIGGRFGLCRGWLFRSACGSSMEGGCRGPLQDITNASSCCCRLIGEVLPTRRLSAQWIWSVTFANMHGVRPISCASCSPLVLGGYWPWYGQRSDATLDDLAHGGRARVARLHPKALEDETTQRTPHGLRNIRRGNAHPAMRGGPMHAHTHVG